MYVIQRDLSSDFLKGKIIKIIYSKQEAMSRSMQLTY